MDTNKWTPTKIAEAREFLRALGEYVNAHAGPDDPEGEFLEEVDFTAVDSHWINRREWPPGLAEYLDGCEWTVTPRESHLISCALEDYWKLPRNWGAMLAAEYRDIEIGWIDNPEVKDKR